LEASRREEEVVKARWLLLATLGALVVGMMALASTAWAAVGAPTVLKTNPANGAKDVALDAKIRVQFSEPMKDRSINPNNIYIMEECTGTIVPATVDYVDEITPVRAVLKPLAPLAEDTNYIVVVDGADAQDGNGVKDATGTPMEKTVTFRFTTGTDFATCPIE
jgi:hypothetical protein